MGGDIPKSYYLTNSTPVPETGMETLNVSAGSSGKKQLEYSISTASSILRLTFLKMKTTFFFITLSRLVRLFEIN